MPLEIRELIIKVNVEPPATQIPVNYEKKLENLKTQVVEECMKKISFLLESFGDR
jgi:hypothetical protein